MSEVKILLAIFFCKAPATSSPTLIIFNLAIYNDNPLLEKAMIIKIGIDQAKVLSCSINIFLTAGSRSQAIPEVLPATTIERTKAIKIFFKCFFTYS